VYRRRTAELPYLTGPELGVQSTLRAIVGPITIHDHLSNPYTACMLIKSVFKLRTTTQIGSLPPIDIPPGAIA